MELDGPAVVAGDDGGAVQPESHYAVSGGILVRTGVAYDGGVVVFRRDQAVEYGGKDGAGGGGPDRLAAHVGGDGEGIRAAKGGLFFGEQHLIGVEEAVLAVPDRPAQVCGRCGRADFNVGDRIHLPAIIYEGREGVERRAYRDLMAVFPVGPAEQHAFEVGVGEAGAAELRNQQSSHAAGHRGRLGSTLHLGVSPSAHGAVDNGIVAAVGVVVAAGGADIHPIPVVGVGGGFSRRPGRTHRYHALVHRRLRPRPALVAGREEHHPALHRAVLVAVLVGAGVFDEVIYGRDDVARRRGRHFALVVVGIVPTVVRQHRTVVRGPDEGGIGAAAVSLFARDGLAVENAHSAAARRAARDSASAGAVIVDGGDNARDVRSVALGSDIVGGQEFGTEEALAAVGAGGDHHAIQVRMVRLHASIHHGHYHLGLSAREALPDGQDVDVATRLGPVHYGPEVVQMPLQRGIRVVEGDERVGRGRGRFFHI